MNLQKLNSLILCNKALISENNCTHLIESGGILTYKEGLSLLGNIMQIQSINVWGGLISLDQVSYRAPGGKEFKAKDVTGSWSTNFILKISFVQRILIWRNFLWKKSHCIFFFPQGPPAFDVILFWCLSFISLIQPMIKSILILPYERMSRLHFCLALVL